MESVAYLLADTQALELVQPRKVSRSGMSWVTSG